MHTQQRQISLHTHSVLSVYTEHSADSQSTFRQSEETDQPELKKTMLELAKRASNVYPQHNALIENWKKLCVSHNYYQILFHNKFSEALPAGTWRLYNVDATSWLCIDVETRLYKRHVPAGLCLALCNSDNDNNNNNSGQFPYLCLFTHFFQVMVLENY